MKVKVALFSFQNPAASRTALVGPSVSLITSTALRSKSRPKSFQSWKTPMIAPGCCSRKTPKMVGKIPPEPVAMGVMSNLSGCQSLEVTPCCSGPAPMIMEAQLGLLEVGMTPRACKDHAPSFIRSEEHTSELQSRFGISY